MFPSLFALGTSLAADCGKHHLMSLYSLFKVSITSFLFQPEYKVADPICTFLFSVFVLCTTVTILRDVFRILMEGTTSLRDQYFFFLTL